MRVPLTSLVSASHPDAPELAVLRGFLDLVAESQYSRPLQVLACHLRDALEREDGHSRLSVAQVAYLIDAREDSVKVAHRRLVDDGVISRRFEPDLGHATQLSLPGLPVARDLAHTTPTPEPAAAAPAALPPPHCQATCEHEPTAPTRPLPPHIEQLRAALHARPGLSAVPVPQAALGVPHAATAVPSPAPASGEDVQINLSPRALIARPAAAPRSEVGPRSGGRTLTRENYLDIEQAVREAVDGSGRQQTYPDPKGLAAQVAWTLANGVYRDRPIEQGLRICLLTIRRGKWVLPKAFSPSEANAISCCR